jgi:hypothetical protein
MLLRGPLDVPIQGQPQPTGASSIVGGSNPVPIRASIGDGMRHDHFQPSFSPKDTFPHTDPLVKKENAPMSDIVLIGRRAS